MIHDVCLNSLPVIFAVDRSGIVGRDGETHQGIYDISYLSSMPNMTVVSPMDGEELVLALDFALEQEDGPVAVRYPRGAAFHYERERDVTSDYSFAKAEILKKGRDVVILAVGNMVKKALSAAALLEKKRIHPTVVNMRFVKPFDEELVLQLVKKNRLIVTMEDNIYSGGFSERIQAFLQSNKKGRIKCLPICFPDAFIEHGDTEELYEKYGLDAQSVAERIEQQL
jgi:1-deoxy-D-xylulose-5-phosphate synthase